MNGEVNNVLISLGRR